MTDHNHLLDIATQYSRAQLRCCGDVCPTLIAITPGDIIVFSPAPLSELAGTTQFAEVARLVAKGFPVEGIVMILKMWSVFTAGDDQPHAQPSQSPDRREVILLSAESRNGNQQQLLVVERDLTGKFTGLALEDSRQFDAAEGPIFGILPGKNPTPTDAATARACLSEMEIFLGKIKRSEMASVYT